MSKVRVYLPASFAMLSELKETLDAAKKAGISAIIASDMAAIEYCRRIGIEVHISTQLNVSNDYLN